MTGDLTLRVIWPVLDLLMSDPAAMREAWIDLPTLAERFQVTISDRPQMQVITLPADQQQAFRATRVVVCRVAVTRRVATPVRALQAA